jgi:acyl dehydratase
MGRSLAREEPGWAFEDARPGITIVHPHGRTIGSDEHVWLALVTSNASDVHMNAEYAGAMEFGRPVVLGALTVAIIVGLSEPLEWPPDAAARGVSLGWRSIRLFRPVAAGDTIRSVSTILTVTPGADGRGGLVRRRITGRNQDDEDVATIEEERQVPRRSG